MDPWPQTIGAVLMTGLAPVMMVAAAMASAIGALSLRLSRMGQVLLGGMGLNLPLLVRGENQSHRRRPPATADQAIARAEQRSLDAEVRRSLDRLVRCVQESVRAAKVRDSAE